MKFPHFRNYRFAILVPLLVLLTSALSINTAFTAETQALESATELLKSKSFKDISKAIDLLAADGSDRAMQLLAALQERKLYTLKKDKVLVLSEKNKREYTIENDVTGAELGTVKKIALKKVRMNNRLRSQIKDALAVMDLKHPDADKRLAAVSQMLDRPDPANAQLLEKQLAEETDPRVRETCV